ncbi:hypothetical protein KDH_08960 [Dictyobacter sp. S3.2.2.5]|uniref:Uncharacterized protein n=1 Tax=Dictyobacter halimunensis TaxID=3026934 RepID=A0ABQ6FNQ3_9CHLR|nr:hypothetical protein KDH_08960 [Dictyobacter sp. S3.2.2.5]
MHKVAIQTAITELRITEATIRQILIGWKRAFGGKFTKQEIINLETFENGLDRVPSILV